MLGFWGSIASIAGLIASVWAAIAANRARISARATRLLLQRQRLADLHLQPLVDLLAAATIEGLTAEVMTEAAEQSAHVVDKVLVEYAGALSDQDERDLYSVKGLLGGISRRAGWQANDADELARDLRSCYCIVVRLGGQLAHRTQD
ncbi:MAG: hypothetical protein KKI08_24370 [Armatimonadetes bacterium]|nr:hypothetical protein [Armatimonadota bacterium]